MSNDLSAQLRAHLQTSQNTETKSTGAPEYLALISEITGQDLENLEPARRLDELGLTSLNLIEFAVRAEDRLGVKFEESDALALETVDLCGQICGGKTMISYLSDMDGVLIKEGEMIPGADKFLQVLKDNEIRFMVLTNNSMATPQGLIRAAAFPRTRHPGG